jgi:hypothetical protein
MFIYRL